MPVTQMAIGINQFLPPGLPQQVADIDRLIRRMADDIAAIREELTPGPAVPELSPRVMMTFTATGGAVTRLQRADSVQVAAILASSDTAGRFVFQVGTDQSFAWRLAANQPFWTVLPPAVLTVPKGVEVIVTPPGSAAYDVVVFGVPADVPGRSS